MNKLIQSIEHFGKNIESFVENFSNDVLKLLDLWSEWATNAFLRILDWLIRFLIAMGSVFVASFKLMLIFSVALLPICYGLYFKARWLTTTGVVFLLLFILIAVFYRPDRAGQSHMLGTDSKRQNERNLNWDTFIGISIFFIVLFWISLFILHLLPVIQNFNRQDVQTRR